MGKKSNIWIVPHKGGWAVKREHGERSIAVTSTKQEAVQIGNNLGRTNQVSVITQRKDGVIQSNDSHGHDPCPPQDKEH